MANWMASRRIAIRPRAAGPNTVRIHEEGGGRHRRAAHWALLSCLEVNGFVVHRAIQHQNHHHKIHHQTNSFSSQTHQVVYVKSAQICLRRPSRLDVILFAFPDHSRTEKFQMCRVCHGGCVVRLFRMKRRDSPPGRAQTGGHDNPTFVLLLRAPRNIPVPDGTSRLHELVPLTRRQPARAIQRCVPGS